MRILVFVENFMGPTLLFIYNEIMELSKTNDVLLLAANRVKGSEKDFPFEKLTVIPFTQNRIIKKINWILEKNDIALNRKNTAFKTQLNKLIETFKPDVIHGHFGYESIILLDNLEHAPCPIFVSFHGYDASEMLRRKSYVKKLNFYFNKFGITPIYVSNFMRQEMENAGLHLKNAKLLYYGTDINYFKPVEQLKPRQKYTFLQISSFNEKKGHIYTLQAYKKFLDLVTDKDTYKLVLAGGGALLDTIKNETEKLGLTNNVEFTGVITYKETYPLLQQADVFVHHSITLPNGMKEGIPNALMEAMAMELPVISTRHAGIPELIEDSVNGYLVNEKDIEAYAKRMKDILTWKHQPQNRKKIQESFSREAHNKNLMNIYFGKI